MLRMSSNNVSMMLLSLASLLAKGHLSAAYVKTNFGAGASVCDVDRSQDCKEINKCNVQCGAFMYGDRC